MEAVCPGRGVCFLELARCRSQSAEVARAEARFSAHPQRGSKRTGQPRLPVVFWSE